MRKSSFLADSSSFPSGYFVFELHLNLVSVDLAWNFADLSHFYVFSISVVLMVLYSQ